MTAAEEMTAKMATTTVMATAMTKTGAKIRAVAVRTTTMMAAIATAVAAAFLSVAAMVMLDAVLSCWLHGTSIP